MATITVNIEISKQRVLDEVAKATAYIGSKAVSAEDPGAYERIANIDADREQLERYWMEACSDASLLLDHWTVTISTQVLTHHPELGRNFTATLAMPTNWPNQYVPTLEQLLTSMIVNSIVAKWLAITLPSQVEIYASLASASGVQVSNLLLMRKRPVPRRSVEPGGDGESYTWETSDIWDQPTSWTTT